MSVNPAPVDSGTPPVWAIWFKSVASALLYSSRSYTVAKLPVAPAGSVTFATDGRKSGELAGAGTGVPVWSDGTVWRTFYDNTEVTA